MFKEKISKLAAKMKESENINLLNEAERDFSAYVKTVADTENVLQIAKIKYEDEDFREYVCTQLLIRKRAFDCIVWSIKLINKICLQYDESAIYSGNLDNKNQVESFCQNVVDELFQNRRALI